jgi:hypothetical protein
LEIQNYLREIKKDSGITLQENAFYLMKINAEYVLARIFKSGELMVKLTNSSGLKILNGEVEYYENQWKSALEEGNGIYKILTVQNYIKIRMKYEHGIQERSNVPVNGDTIIFRTIPANVRLLNSQNTPIDEGVVQYYSGGWYDLGTTGGGIARKEMLPGNYKFRMKYSNAVNEKYQNIADDSVVVFRTVRTNVELRDSHSAPMDTGTVKYYSGGWYDMGTTSGGSLALELLPYNYKFRMTYRHASVEKYQDIGIDPTVTFSTAKTRVELRNSMGNPMDAGSVKYYSGGWFELGQTSGGIVELELLPFNYKFRMTYLNASNEKYQDIGIDPTVTFSTAKTRVELRNSMRNPMDAGSVKYYSGGWYDLGTTSGGITEMELLPYNYKFRMTYEHGSNEKYQDTGVNPTVLFQTVSATVELKNSENALMDMGQVKYYSGGWWDLGNTSGGRAVKELLPFNYKFRMTYEHGTNEKCQDLSVNPVVTFGTIRTGVRVLNTQNQLLSGADVKYYSGGWYPFGVTSEDMVLKELLPFNYKFRAAFQGVQSEKYQDISTNPTVEFQLQLP